MIRSSGPLEEVELEYVFKASEVGRGKLTCQVEASQRDQVQVLAFSIDRILVSYVPAKRVHAEMCRESSVSSRI